MHHQYVIAQKSWYLYKLVQIGNNKGVHSTAFILFVREVVIINLSKFVLKQQVTKKFCNQGQMLCVVLQHLCIKVCQNQYGINEHEECFEKVY